jgi:carnitine-CoA ligase
VKDFLDRALSAGGDRPFLLFRGRTWSYADALSTIEGVEAELRGKGLSPGDRLAIHLPTGPGHLFLWLATARAGIVSCPIHTELALPEVDAALALLRPRAIVDAAGLRVRKGAVPTDASIATILATSGTTGPPKAAMLSGRMAALTGEGFAHWLRLTPADRLFTCLPLSHINARFYSTLGALAAGASLALEERFSASRFWTWMRESGATEVNAIGAMLKILMDRPASPEDREHGLRLVYSAPALGREAHLAFEQRFGVRLVIGYGLTESTFGLIHPLDDTRDLDAMGAPRGIDAEVRLEDGELQLRNPATFSGYLDDEEATREAWTDDGWLRTGDLARREASGQYTFLGRKKLVIRRRGENLTPGEVEAVLECHPAVREAGVIGVPSPVGEDDVLACVVLRTGCAASGEELAAHCAVHLAPFKVPTRWRFFDALPRTPTQRIAYDALRAAVEAEADGSQASGASPSSNSSTPSSPHERSRSSTHRGGATNT